MEVIKKYKILNTLYILQFIVKLFANSIVRKGVDIEFPGIGL